MKQWLATPDDEVYAFGFVCQEFDVVIPERTLCSQSEQLFVPLRLPTTWRYSRKFSERRTTSYVTTGHASLNGDVAADPIDND